MNSYLLKFCEIDLIRAGLASCVAIIITLFGEDHTAITVAFWLCMLNSIIEMYASNERFTRKARRTLEKWAVMGVLFVTVALLAILYPELSHLIIFLPTLVAVNEGYLIVENVHKIYPNIITSTILESFGAIKSRVSKELTKK